MQSPAFDIDPDIGRASTPPAAIYRSPEIFQWQKESIFARSWHMLPGAERVKAPGHLLPFRLLDGCLGEPLVLACGDDGELRDTHGLLAARYDLDERLAARLAGIDALTDAVVGA